MAQRKSKMLWNKSLYISKGCFSGFEGFEIMPARDLMDLYIAWCIKKLDGDKAAVAAKLKISQKTIYNRMMVSDIIKAYLNV